LIVMLISERSARGSGVDAAHRIPVRPATRIGYRKLRAIGVDRENGRDDGAFHGIPAQKTRGIHAPALEGRMPGN
jgi:hypothetical protein